MAVLKSIDKSSNELVIMCKCGCCDGMRVKIDDSYGDFAYQTYLSSNWCAEQKHPFKEKLKKIFAILRNKDYYYSEIIMTKEDFKLFKNFVNEVGDK